MMIMIVVLITCLSSHSSNPPSPPPVSVLLLVGYRARWTAAAPAYGRQTPSPLSSPQRSGAERAGGRPAAAAAAAASGASFRSCSCCLPRHVLGLAWLPAVPLATRAGVDSEMHKECLCVCVCWCRVSGVTRLGHMQAIAHMDRCSSRPAIDLRAKFIPHPARITLCPF